MDAELQRSFGGHHTAGETDHLIDSREVTDTTVRGRNGETIGEIEFLMIDKQSGQVRYAVMSFGGFLGLGEKHYPIPWNALRYNSSTDTYEVDITEEQVRSAPEFDESSGSTNWSNREWAKRLYTHYGTTPYWAR